MEKLKLTNEEMRHLRLALQFYCEETTHERKDLPKENGVIVSAPGLNPKTRESQILENIRNKLRTLNNHKR